MAEITKYKRLAVFEGTEALLRVLSKEKGVSIGVYLQKLIPYVSENGIDYTEADREGDQIKKRIEAGIKIQRAMEKTYFIPLLEKLRALTDNFEMVLPEASIEEDIERENMMIADQDVSDRPQQKIESYRLVAKDMEWLLNQGQERKGKFTIELTAAEMDRFRNALNKIHVL